ncbi:hypothetical protein [Tenacibaculum finnmarkense]|nr:hypothetical protein [Tenacibaculum finnmarkense]MCD8439535.1 hypothetical protein [Tenacibaculum finnmarkense genomovar ulcerans]MCG8207829.1 hypothetical protein [Tenacibaculum finnmarkense genomovar finnmarkense]MCG8720384.1 hypothetical protein [Tenacibaculum finnmarkense]MCG8723883.1 hypothetical protein [Tenacibaculum finnmarkense]MCG8742214.1 hypothetical protein [Tenacibaculum finnmarkense]
MFNNKLKYFIVFILLSNCSFDKQKVNKINKKIDSSTKNANPFLNILIGNDTIYKNIKNGKVIFFYQLDDTLKIEKKDKRNIYLALTIKPGKGNKNIEKEKFIYQKELDFSISEFNDTISIPFNIKPSFKGKATIYGAINDSYSLNSYTHNQDKVRLITYEYNFEKNVFIK